MLVYPRLVDLDALFSDSGARALEGRRLLLRRPTGFDLHSVRDYEQGESLRRVHWPTTARRGHLMVKELEDAPRDETAVLLDGDAGAIVGVAPDNTFELQVQAAGSILKAHAARGRRAALIVNCASRAYQRVHSFDGDWLRALEMLAAVEPDGPTPVAALLADEAGPASRALELTVVTASLTPRLAERLAQRVFQRHSATLVYVDPASFAPGGDATERDPGRRRSDPPPRASGRPGRRPPPRRRPRLRPRREPAAEQRLARTSLLFVLSGTLIAGAWLRLETGGAAARTGPAHARARVRPDLRGRRRRATGLGRACSRSP